MAKSDARAKAAKLKEKARQRRETREQTPDTDMRESAKSKRRKLKEKGTKAAKSVAGTLTSVAGTLKQGASQMKADAQSAMSDRDDGEISSGDSSGNGRKLRVTYRSETGEWGVEGPTAGFGTYETKAEAKDRAREVYNNQDKYTDEAKYSDLVIETKEGARQTRTGPSDGQNGSGSDNRSTLEVFGDGLSEINQRLGPEGDSFTEKAKEYEPQAAEGEGDEGENDASGAAILAGAGFGGQGDPPTIVGVDQNRDGQFQRDEIAFLGPPKEAETPEQTRQSPQPDPSVLSFGMDSDVSTEPIVPGFGGNDSSEGPMLPGFDAAGDSGSGPTVPEFEGNGDPQIPMLDGTDNADDKQGEPDSDMFVGNGPRF